MCGIVGIVDYNREKITDIDTLSQMTKVIEHRGPDSDGHWQSESAMCGLGFRRLAIIDLSIHGSQPMHSPDGRFTIVFNGEIYNHEEIRKNLIQSGYNYRSRTDTETILYGYMQYGEKILEMMVGMWAFAIWDSHKQELFAARDRIGVKPFYYCYQAGRFIFASEIKSILQHPSVIRNIDYSEIANYLNFGMSGRNSLFQDISKLPNGHKLRLDSDGNYKINRYWSPFSGQRDLSGWSETDISDETIRLLQQSVKDRMMSDVPFGVFLSGGIDSSLNVALMAELMDRPIDTYTVGFKELEKYNELEYARLISRKFETNHHEILIDDSDALTILDKLVWHEDEPNADPVCIPLYFLSKLTRDSGTTVIQVGEGSDEQFIGYKWMLRDFNFYNTYWRAFTSLPQFLRKSVYDLSKPLFEWQNQLLALDYIRKGADNNPFYWSGVSIFSPSHQKLLFTQKYNALSKIAPLIAELIQSEAKSLRSNFDQLQLMSFMELSIRLPEILLMRVDKIGMAHSIEARVPFLDHRLVEFTMSIPSQLKVPNSNISKSILKSAVSGYIPDEIINRKKQGFWAPVNEWMRNQWYDMTKDELLNSYFVKEGIFNKDYISKIIELNKSGKQNNGYPIFALLMLSLWQKKFFN